MKQAAWWRHALRPAADDREGRKALKAAYLYAVATKKESRGQGYCRAVWLTAGKGASQAVRGGASFKPCDAGTLRIFMPDSAFPAQTGGSKQIFDCAEAKGQATEIGVQDYAGLRETALWDISHVRYDKAQLEYAVSGGKFYCLMAGYSMGCAAVKAGDAGTPGVRLRTAADGRFWARWRKSSARANMRCRRHRTDRTAKRGACSSGSTRSTPSSSPSIWALPSNNRKRQA